MIWWGGVKTFFFLREGNRGSLTFGLVFSMFSLLMSTNALTIAFSSAFAPFRNSLRIAGSRRTSFSLSDFRSMARRMRASGGASGCQSPAPTNEPEGAICR